MPIYEYTCNSCKKEFSLIQSVGTTEADTICPECGSNDIKKILSAFSCCSSSATDSSLGASYSGGG